MESHAWIVNVARGKHIVVGENFVSQREAGRLSAVIEQSPALLGKRLRRVLRSQSILACPCKKASAHIHDGLEDAAEARCGRSGRVYASLLERRSVSVIRDSRVQPVSMPILQQQRQAQS